MILTTNSLVILFVLTVAANVVSGRILVFIEKK